MSPQENTEYKNLQPDHQPVPIVAIGGSAGAQKAVLELLKHLPADTGLAYVYIQHLSPDYKSKLSQILSRATQMTVQEATPLLEVRPNHLYIIPPNKSMEIIDGVLVLTRRKPRPNIHLPIDQFFTSLAERQKDGAIGIVLSGMASDGTQGLKAIKVAGGVTFVQDQSAEHQSMPQSAISEGVVDMILPPSEIAAELVKLSQRANIFLLTSETQESALDDFLDEDLDKILEFVKSGVGVDFRRYKKTTIRRRIIRRMLLYRLDTLAEYARYLEQHPEEASALYKDLLINVTSFFRDEKTMDYVKKTVLPGIFKSKHPSDPIRIWVAGCSTGQEAYSLAMILIEVLGDRATTVPIQIFATDLSEDAIAKARLGSYTRSEVEEVPQQRLERFFTAFDDQFRINKPIRDLCVFAPHDLLSDPPFSRLDMISCRNLLIYLDDTLQKKALATFHYALNLDGILLLGKSEAVGSSPAHFSQVDKEFKVFVRKNTTQARIPMDLNMKRNLPIFQKRGDSGKGHDSIHANDIDKLVDSWLLTNHFPASVVVDQDLEILHFRGATSLFLEHTTGKASLNLAKMARPALVFELRNAIHKARKTGEPVTKSGLELIVGNKTHYVSIKAIPIVNSAKQQLFLVMLEEIDETKWMRSEAAGDIDKRNLALESELAALRQDMHSIIEEQEASNEELQSANEEIISSNEELQSINEELETSKEEIESANEELQTINQELQVRNDQLSESYEYSEAILSTINEATLVLDAQLRVKSANRAFYRIFHADPVKIEGSTIYELADHQLDFIHFKEAMHQVLQRDQDVKGFEVRLKLGKGEDHVMLVHARKISLHQKQTVLLVFEEITEHRRSQELLRERQQWFEDLVDNANAFIWVSSIEGKINYLNKAWLEFTGQSFDKRKGHSIIETIHPEDRKAYIALTTDQVRRRNPYQIEYRLRRRDGEYHWVLENAKPMLGPDGIFTGYIGTSTDIHLQKTLTEQLNENVESRTTELRKANEGLQNMNLALSATAARLKSVLDGVPAAVTLMEPIVAENKIVDFNTIVYNDKALELTGQSESDITDKTLLQSLPAMIKTGLFDLYKQVFQTGQAVYHEVSALNLPEQTLAFLITRQIDKKGIVVTALDISERVNAETNLATTAENLQAVLNSSPASIAFFKAEPGLTQNPEDFKLAVCNQRFADSVGKQIKNLIGHMASELYNTADQQWILTAAFEGRYMYREIFEPSTQQWSGVSVSRHDHGIAITELDITPLKNTQQKQKALMGQLDSSYQIVESLSVLKEYVQNRGAFLRSTFHDLRGSFGIVSGAATLLQYLDTEEEKLKTVDIIQRNLGQIMTMMNQLLDYARLEAGEEKLEIEPFDVSVVLTELCQAASQSASDKGLLFEFQGPDRLSAEGDIVKIRRVAQNLVLNAVKYTDQGTVAVEWIDIPSTSTWELTVLDTGPGIPDRVVSRLFEAKYTENQSPTTGDVAINTQPDLNQSEGIGLFIVKQLVQLMGGQINVETRISGGTRVRVIFPLVSPNHSQA